MLQLMEPSQLISHKITDVSSLPVVKYLPESEI